MDVRYMEYWGESPERPFDRHFHWAVREYNANVYLYDLCGTSLLPRRHVISGDSRPRITDARDQEVPRS
jgi:hypothetical protein